MGSSGLAPALHTPPSLKPTDFASVVRTLTQELQPELGPCVASRMVYVAVAQSRAEADSLDATMLHTRRESGVVLHFCLTVNP